MAAPAEIGSPGGLCTARTRGKTSRFRQTKHDKEGTQTDPHRRPQIIRQVSIPSRSRMLVLGPGCPVLCRSNQPTPALNPSEQGGEIHARLEKFHLLAGWQLGNQQRKCQILRIFYSVFSVHREQTLVLLQPPTQLCPPKGVRTKQGWRRCRRRDGSSPPWYHTLAISLCFFLFLFSYP